MLIVLFYNELMLVMNERDDLKALIDYVFV